LGSLIRVRNVVVHNRRAADQHDGSARQHYDVYLRRPARQGLRRRSVGQHHDSSNTLSIATELRATRMVLADRGIVIAPEELAAAPEAIPEVGELEKAAMPSGRAADLADFAEQLRRMLEDLQQ